MKYYSEKTKKFYDEVEELNKAELEFDEEAAAKKELEAKKSKAKKELVEKIKEVDQYISEAYKKYDEIQNEAQKIIERAHEEAKSMKDKAYHTIYDAEWQKKNLVRQFIEEYGSYHEVYTGEKAEEEWNRFNKMLDFDVFKFFDFMI